jgi:hypothetical protein
MIQNDQKTVYRFNGDCFLIQKVRFSFHVFTIFNYTTIRPQTTNVLFELIQRLNDKQRTDVHVLLNYQRHKPLIKSKVH